MMWRTRAVVVAVIGIGAWYALRGRRERVESAANPAQTEHVLRDLVDQRYIDWETSTGEHPVRGAAVEFRNAQETPATIVVSHNGAEIYGEDWRIIVDLGLVHEVVCVRQFVHWPEPGFVRLHVGFRNEPEDEFGHANEVLTVWFEEAHETQFRNLCDRNGLRKIGDFGARATASR